MEQKKFIQVLRKIVKEEVRSVIKEELTEILQEGLQRTVNEIKKPVPEKKHNKFKENKFSDVLNQTDVLHEPSNYANIMNENIFMDSRNAKNFGVQSTMTAAPIAPQVMQDPETGKSMKVDNVIAKAMTRDYSALMKAIDKKKSR